jgi:hypothetical protein
LVAVAAAGPVFPSPAAATVVATRCAIDRLDPATARLRLEWARACGTSVNVVSPTNPKPPAFVFQTGGVSDNGTPLVEYVETDDFFGRNSYSGVDAMINQAFIQNQWRVGLITATPAAGGFQKWTEPPALALARPFYPVFGNSSDINVAVPLYPSPNYARGDCRLYTDPAGTHLADTSVTGFYVNAYCTSDPTFVPGCADGTVEQLFANGMVGCAGTATFASRGALCGPGYQPATAAQWAVNHGPVSPLHDYWTNDALRWGGTGPSACFVSTTAGSDTCGASPMRVCTATGTDTEGNTCNWTHCGLETNAPDQFFGGCGSNAGVVCVPSP